MLETAAFHIVIAKRIHNTSAIFDKSAIRVKINAQSSQSNNYLCSRFSARTVNAAKASVIVLDLGQAG